MKQNIGEGSNQYGSNTNQVQSQVDDHTYLVARGLPAAGRLRMPWVVDLFVRRGSSVGVVDAERGF